MEGAGLYVSSYDNKVDWIVVKAICDWGNGNKEVDKTPRQQQVAKNAAEFVVQSLKNAQLRHPKPWESAPPLVASDAQAGVRLEAGSALSAAQGAQKTVIGDVTGSNNTVTVTQNQGLTIEDVARLLQTVEVGPTDAHAEIEAAGTHLTGGDLSIAIYLLSDLKKRKWDKLSAARSTASRPTSAKRWSGRASSNRRRTITSRPSATSPRRTRLAPWRRSHITTSTTSRRLTPLRLKPSRTIRIAPCARDTHTQCSA